MSFSTRILVGLVTGVAVGLFFGELIAPIKVVADGFVKLLQMTVLPYVTISIISSLGSLSFDEAKRLGLRAGAVLVGLWAVALTYTFVFPLTFPAIETASFFSSTLVERRSAFNFVDLFIPSNPFHSLANNVVPAVVLFAVMMGVALIGVERKQVLLDVLSVASVAISRATRFVVKLTPYGIFAIAAWAAGTLNIEQIGRIQVYLISYVAIALLVALWVLPGLVAALTPIGYREVLGPTRDALITAFMAGDLFIVLPILVETCKDLLARRHLTDEHTASLPEVIVPTSFNFPHTGKLLSLSFILFAGWFSDIALPIADYPRLAITGLLTFFGSLNVAVPFLLDAFRIPADTFQLFLATGVINSRVGALVAAVHTIAVALLGTAAIVGAIRFEPARILRYTVITLVVTIATVVGLRTLFSTVLRQQFSGSEIVYGMEPAFAHPPSRLAKATIEATDTAPETGPVGSVIDAAKARGRLRVGILPDRLPYAFINAKGDLVGLDIDMAHQLARDLGTGIEFVQVDVEGARDQLNRGVCDIVMSGILVTPRRAAAILFSEPYLDETLAFVVKDHLRDRFASWASARNVTDVTVGIPNVPYYVDVIRDRAPQLKLNLFDITYDPFKESPDLDAYVLPAERGSVLTLLHPDFTVVVPEPGAIKVPLAYPLARHDDEWAAFVNTWIELKRRDGTIDALYRHWILGQEATRRQPRWSVVRNVLNWVD